MNCNIATLMIWPIHRSKYDGRVPVSDTGWSLTETRALAVKAARGAGFSWGLAEEAGFAVEWLETRGAQGTKALAAYLDEGIVDESCPIKLGAALCDGALDFGKIIDPIRQPLLFVPFFVTAFPEGSHRLEWGSAKCSASGSGIVLKGDGLAQLAGVTITPCDEPISTNKISRVPKSQAQAMRRLAVHAHKTYAPATEASRLAGAGAGLSDND